jgi:hypothetical protein
MALAENGTLESGRRVVGAHHRDVRNIAHHRSFLLSEFTLDIAVIDDGCAFEYGPTPRRG